MTKKRKLSIKIQPCTKDAFLSTHKLFYDVIMHYHERYVPRIRMTKGKGKYEPLVTPDHLFKMLSNVLCEKSLYDWEDPIFGGISVIGENFDLFEYVVGLCFGLSSEVDSYMKKCRKRVDFEEEIIGDDYNVNIRDFNRDVDKMQALREVVEGKGCNEARKMTHKEWMNEKSPFCEE